MSVIRVSWRGRFEMQNVILRKETTVGYVLRLSDKFLFPLANVTNNGLPFFLASLIGHQIC